MHFSVNVTHNVVDKKRSLYLLVVAALAELLEAPCRETCACISVTQPMPRGGIIAVRTPETPFASKGAPFPRTNHPQKALGYDPFVRLLSIKKMSMD